MPKGPHDDDELSEEELRALEEFERDPDLPPPDKSDEALPGNDDGAPAGEDDDSTAPKPAAPVVQPAAGEDDDDDELNSFLDRHKGKSPEEIAKLAWQQSKRASRAEFSTRETQQRLGSVLERIQQARDAKLSDIGQRRAAFEAKVKDDPDAALLEARNAEFEREQSQAERDAEAAETEARAIEAVQMAAACIPDFQTAAPQIKAFAGELGFSADEVNAIVDGRQIVTLHLARIAGNMLKAGIIDNAGKFIGMPEPARADPAPAQRPRSLSNTPARGAGAPRPLMARAEEVLGMDDAAFDNISEAELNALLKELEGQ